MRNAKQGGEIRSRWPWVESRVWTDRMLEALERGMKGGKRFSLIDEIWSPKTLQASWERVRRNGGAAGVDRQGVERFEAKAEDYLAELSLALQEGTYRPQPVRRQWIPKPGSSKKRPLGIPTVKDRVVQGAIRLVLEPIFERQFSARSFGFRPRRGCKDALRSVQQLLDEGYVWIIDADIQSYFDNINHEILMETIAETISDSRLLELIRRLLDQPIMDGLEEWNPIKGTPQGAVLSPLLANLYLHSVDACLEQAGIRFARYADDLVLLCKSEDEARRAHAMLVNLMESRKLDLHPEKTKMVDARQAGGFDFLGYHFERGKRRPRDKSMKSFKDKIRKLTPRHPGISLEVVIERLNPTLRGWFEYFKHSAHWVFYKLDGWIRMRLRTILRHYHGGSGRGGGKDHYRWPNAFFAELGLFTLKDARARILQSR